MSRAYRYVGDGAYMMGVPARDLTPADLAEVERRERITEAEIAASGLYAPMEDVEVAPFCGAELPEGGRCQEPVESWGERCEEHKEIGDG